jgi:ryanodine receptor 2
MQDKLSKDPLQIELLREFMNLQKEMMIMLLSMLEGNVVNGPIGKQMVDTLVESSANFEMILKFFDIFLKMKDLTTSEAFMDIDENKDGIVSHKEFRRAMEQQKVYTDEEIEYIMMCVDANQDGKIDFHEFTDRFHNPAKDIGFNVAVLLTNLTEHMPNDPRLQRFLEKARSVLDYFEQFLGRIEIMGSAGRIERVYFEITQSHIDQWEKPQIKDSKRAFLHECVNEEGDKEKLDAFVNFCEDTIFEMQHATSISVEEQNFSFGQLLPGGGDSKMRKEGGITETIKNGFGQVKDAICFLFSCLSPSNIRNKYRLLRSMTAKEVFLAFLKVNFNLVLLLFTFLFTVMWTLCRFIYNMMMSDKSADERRRSLVLDQMPLKKGERPASLPALKSKEVGSLEEQTTEKSKLEAFGLELTKEEGEGGEFSYRVTGQKPMSPQSSTDMSEEDMALEAGQAEGMQGQDVADGSISPKPPTTVTTPSPSKAATKSSLDLKYEEEAEMVAEESTMDSIDHARQRTMDLTKYILSMFARNFYNFKLIALALAFSINFILLFFKASQLLNEDGGGDAGDAAAAAEGEEEEDPLEMVDISENVSYLAPLIRLLAMLHTFVAFSMLVAYYCLKVPLVVFKREKEVCRSLEFDGMWISEQAADDDIKGHWDKLVISTRSFPDKYWDKFVKKKVRNKYSEQYDHDQITALLGMDQAIGDTQEDRPSLLPSFLSHLDWQYQIWKWGIIFTDNSFLYIVWYFTFSLLGNFNYFFFAAHLLDVAVCFKTLGTILASVTHNGKQLVLTVLLLSIVVYVYTVIAFNFFRKFYVKDEDGEVDYKCHDMLTCYVFHLYVGVRAGGGIGDEIEPPDGDPYEVYRILFDITFFFFVIIILLAIIQGLIIDAFGELRDQLEQVKEDLESSCFICGIGKDYFDKVPHGFETHVKNEHNFANYMFFLMHLINKPDTEYTGQETYVWQLYQGRNWDFFPVGDCFRKQYEDELGSG